MHTIALPWQIFDAIRRFISLFADDDQNGDGDGAADKDAEDDKDIDSKWDDDGDDDFKDDDDEDKGKDKDDKKSKSGDKKDSSAIHQKQKYREQLKEAKAEIARLKGQGKPTGEEEKKAKSARDWLRGEMAAIAQEEDSTIDELAEELEEEVDDLVDDNDDLTKEQILDAMEEYEGISPSQAVKIIRRIEKSGDGVKTPKPKVPSPRDTDTSVRDSGKKDAKVKKPETFEEVGRRIKDRLGLGRRSS